MQTPVASAWLGFLSPEETVQWLPPDALTQYLARRLSSVEDEPAFVAANRLALEAYRSGFHDAAVRVCHAASRYAWREWERTTDAHLIALGLQPLINLILIDGYVDDFARAMSNMSELEKIADGKSATLYGLTLPAEVFHGVDDRRSPMIISSARANCLQETAKILWRRHRYHELLDVTTRLAGKWPEFTMYRTYHSVEARWMLDAPTNVSLKRPDGWPRMLHRICMQHHVARTDDVEMAFTLFTTRPTNASPKAANAAARDIAVLGDSLTRAGHEVAGGKCFEEAHDIARRIDPGLANLIRSRWAMYIDDAGIPPIEDCARLPWSMVQRAWLLSAERFEAKV